jgi:putative ABC transport system permease protein
MRRAAGGALAHPMRLARTAAAVSLAVSLVAGTFVLTDTIASALQHATASGDDVDVVVRSTAAFTPESTTLSEREPVPDSLLEAVLAVPGVRDAWGSLTGYAEVVGADPDRPAIGTAWVPEATMTAGRAPAGPDEVVLDAETAAAQGLRLGDRVRILVQGAVEEFTVAGLRRVADRLRSSQATFDLRTAQRVLGQRGTVDAIPVRAEPGVSAETIRGRVGAVLPDRYEVVTADHAAEEAEESWSRALGFLTTGLLLFSGVALLVGAFLIFNTFSILVAQRTREVGLLRAIGAGRGRITRSVLGEALALGVVASIIGVVLGLGAAKGLLALMRVAGLDLPEVSAVFRARTAGAGLVCGVVVTLAAAAGPARRATRVPPVAALSGAGPDGPTSVDRAPAMGVAVAAVGVALLAAGLFAEVGRPLPVIVAGAAGLLGGLGMLIPLIARPAAHLLARPLVRVLGQPALLASGNAARNPRRTAATAAAVMIGITLVGVVGILAASMKSSATRSVEDTLRADLVVSARAVPGAATGVPTQVADRLRRTPGVAGVSQIRTGQWGLDGRARSLLAVDPATVAEMHALDPASAAAVGRLDDRSVLVRENVAARHGWKVGDEVPMTFARTGAKTLRLAATFSTATVRSDYVISLAAFKANYARQADTFVDVRLAPGVTLDAGRARVTAALADFGGADVRDRSQVLAASRDQVDRLLLPVTALLALSVLIALLGITNTIALSIAERWGELGLLRAVGMERGQLRSMVRAEAAIISCLGSLLGVVVALFLGWALVRAMADVGVTELAFPVGQLAALVAAATAAGMGAGVLPARRAARRSVLEAVGAG